jgi:hypothetical protein
VREHHQTNFRGEQDEGRNLIGGDGIIELTGLFENIPKVAVCISELRTESYRLLIVRDRCLQLTFSFKDT